MRQAVPGPEEKLLLVLAAELVDAHVDTVELALDWADELRWQAHLDYLRALVRTTERILAAGLVPADTAAATDRR